MPSIHFIFSKVSKYYYNLGFNEMHYRDRERNFVVLHTSFVINLNFKWTIVDYVLYDGGGHPYVGGGLTGGV